VCSREVFRVSLVDEAELFEEHDINKRRYKHAGVAAATVPLIFLFTCSAIDVDVLRNT
jgi:hypothetical protein